MNIKYHRQFTKVVKNLDRASASIQCIARDLSAIEQALDSEKQVHEQGVQVKVYVEWATTVVVSLINPKTNKRLSFVMEVADSGRLKKWVFHAACGGDMEESHFRTYAKTINFLF